MPRVHGNTRRIPHNALSFDATQSVIKFLLDYAEQNAVVLPGRVPGYSRSDIKLLPSSMSKRSIWKVFRDSEESSLQSLGYSTFCRLWRNLLPSVLVMKPMTDLCWTCQKNNSAIIRSVNCSEQDKSDVLKKAEEHLRIVHVERSFFTAIVAECSKSIREHYTNRNNFEAPPPSSFIKSNTVSIKAHYSFDYAQQVHFPSDPMQPGPIYFLTTRKCSIFGVNCEAIPRQVNFLTDESGETGKGANTVISRVHYFFESHSMGEKDVYLHADNCAGQNKNNSMMQYLLWRVITNHHSNITLSFLVTGHTKFSPDWWFGLFKRLYRRTRVGSIADIARVTEKSAVCNTAQVEDGNTVVETYDWSTYLTPHFRRINGIKQYHHFRFSSSHPNVVFVREHADTEEISLTITKNDWKPDSDELPHVLHPKGLTVERQWYLHDSIRPFCPDESKDVACPRPLAPNPKRRRTPEHEDIDQ